MNRKQFTLLLVLLIVLGGAGLYLRQKQNASWRGANPQLGKKLLGEFPINDVAQILIRSGTNEVVLAKQQDTWRVQQRDNYPANFSEISEFLITAKDLKVVQTEEVGPSQLPRLWLVEGQGTNTATAVTFKDASGKEIASMLLGKKHMQKSNRSAPSPFGDMGGEEGFPVGRYVKVGQGTKNIALISDPLSNIEPKADQWINKDFFKAEKLKTLAVTFPVASNSWAIARETESGEWKLQEAKTEEKLDSGKISGAANALSYPSFNDVVAGSKADQYGLSQPTVITAATFDGFNYTLLVGQKTNDAYPVKVNVAAQLVTERTPGQDEKPEDKEKLDKEFKEKVAKLQEKLDQEKTHSDWIYLVSSWSLEQLLKERHQLLVEKKDAAAPGAPPLPGNADEHEGHDHDQPLGNIMEPDADEPDDDGTDPGAAPGSAN